jgi:hypothetical protein
MRLFLTRPRLAPPALPAVCLSGALIVALLVSAAPAGAASAPLVGATWSTNVLASSATLHGEVNPNGLPTTYRFEYITDAAYQENLAASREGFEGAAKAPAGSPASAGSGTGFLTVSQHISALSTATLYHYRLAATSIATTYGAPTTFRTQEVLGAFTLPDERGWELVSPPDKNGGAIQAPGQNHGGGVIQASPQGYPAHGAITYSSSSSFGDYEAGGAPPASQYISRRSETGWSTQNITAPTVSGSYGNEPNGVPYQLFSPDLARGLMLNGIHCRGEGSGCPVANPPLPGSEAPEGFQDYYLRNDETDAFTALMTQANSPSLTESADWFNLALAGASPDLRHVILSTCAALTPGATEVPGSEGCDPAKPNLYEYSEGQLTLVNVNPGAELAAQSGAVSADGSRVYFTEAGALYRREGALLVQVDEAQGGGGEFQAATPNGEVAFFTKAGHLYRFRVGEGLTNTVDLTPSGGVAGVLGASADGQTVYYQDAGGLEQWREGATTAVAPGAQAAQPSDWPSTTGTARVSADGEELLFLSKEPLTGYDNTDQTTGNPDSEVYLYSAQTGEVLCLSCNPTGERPLGPSTIPGAYANGAAPGSTDTYKPRVLSADGRRVFFDSRDALVALDVNKASDVYQWEASGEGSCQRPGGCLNLISNGQDPIGASFIDASESGADAYFLTSASLVPADPGSTDVYDARIKGGFPEPEGEIPCKGDECQRLPAQPEDPSVGTLIPGLGNGPVHFPKTACPPGRHQAIRKGAAVCVATHHHHHKRRHHGRKKRGHR